MTAVENEQREADGSGVVLWLTGLSGAGKTTLALKTGEALRARGRRVEILDGDIAREKLSTELGFTREHRDTHVARVAYVAHLLARNGVTVIVALISPFRAAREDARRLCGRFIEVHVSTPLEVCIQRDVKGLYARALRNEIPHFTGIGSPYEPPLTPELSIDTSHTSVEGAVATIVAAVD
jgi:adenylylsulfate kinase